MICIYIHCIKERKKERKKETLMICIYTLHQRKKERKKRKKERKKERKRHVRPAKTQISLDIRPVWSEFSLSAWRKLGSLPTHWAHIEEYDQTGRMPRLIWVFAVRKDHFVGLVMRRLIYFRRVSAFKLKCSCWKEKCRCVDIFCEISPRDLNVIIQIYQFCRS